VYFVSFQTLCVAVSVLTLTAISIERWYAICHPLRFHSTVGRARLTIVLIWAVSACAALPEFIFSEEVKWRPNTILFSSCYPALMNPDHMVLFNTILFSSCYPALMNPDHMVLFQCVLMVAFYFLPISLMAFTYTHIAIVLMNGHIPGEPRTFLLNYYIIIIVSNVYFTKNVIRHDREMKKRIV